MSRPQKCPRISSADFDGFANDVAMAVWNRIAKLPEFHQLKPNDYPEIFEALRMALRRYVHDVRL